MSGPFAFDTEAIDTDVLVVDRDADILDFPRAVGIDDESLRTYQAAGWSRWRTSMAPFATCCWPLPRHSAD